jgi:hypothetical protein
MIRSWKGFCFSTLAFVAAASATTVVSMSLEELTRRSDTAIVGKVKSVSYGQNDQAGYPETRTTFTVEDTVYGEGNGQEITLCVPGGPAGNGLYTLVPGMPQFKSDEKAVLFLVKDKNRGLAFPTGAEQGVFRIKIDPETDQPYVFNQAHDLSMVNLDGSNQKQTESKAKTTLSEFKIQVRQLAVKVKDQ